MQAVAQRPVAARVAPRAGVPALPSLRGAPLRRAATKANAALATQIPQMTDAERKALAEEVGFKCIGKELDDKVTLTEIVKSMPAEVFEIDNNRAWLTCATSVVAFSFSLWLISISPWYMLPFAWVFSGTALTGWFVIGHECGHRSFHTDQLIEDIVGHIAFAPLLYPFECWRIMHNHHHAHTNKLGVDNAWHPAMEEDMAKWSDFEKGLYRWVLGTPLKFWASVGHQIIYHFDLDKYTEKQKPRVMISIACSLLSAAILIPTMVSTVGVWGLVKFWLMPWLGYHFWMSCFTVVHHTAPHISFQPVDKWNAAKAQLSGTVHCDYPAWVDFLTHDISWHVPHHVNSRIPWYNLRKATESLRSNWGDYMTECTFNWRAMKNIITHCHVYDKDLIYKPFDFKKEEPLFAFQRKVLPDGM